MLEHELKRDIKKYKIEEVINLTIKPICDAIEKEIKKKYTNNNLKSSHKKNICFFNFGIPGVYINFHVRHKINSGITGRISVDQKSENKGLFYELVDKLEKESNIKLDINDDNDRYKTLDFDYPIKWDESSEKKKELALDVLSTKTVTLMKAILKIHRS